MQSLAELQEAEKVVLLLRVFPSLKKRLATYARARGLTLNASAAIVLDEGLPKED